MTAHRSPFNTVHRMVTVHRSTPLRGERLNERSNVQSEMACVTLSTGTVDAFEGFRPWARGGGVTNTLSDSSQTVTPCPFSGVRVPEDNQLELNAFSAPALTVTPTPGERTKSPREISR